MKKNKLIFLMLIIITNSEFNLYAFEPDLSIGSTVFYEEGSEKNDPDFFTGVNADVFQRKIHNSGYYSWYAGSDFRYNTTDSAEYEDFEMIALDIHHDIGSIACEGSSSAVFSFHNIDYSVYANPDWRASVIYTPPESLYSMEINYTGSFVYQDTGMEDRLINTLEIMGLYDPSLRFGTSVSLKGGIENYSEYYRINNSGAETDSLRTDKFITASLLFEGLAGYFSDWEFKGRIKLLDSNANRFLALSGLENDSEDYTSFRFDAVYNWSPLISLELNWSGFCEYFKYSERNEVNSSGIFTGSELKVLDTGGIFEAGWTMDNSLFWIFSVSLFKSFSSDPSFDEWSSRIGGRLKYSF